MLSHPYCRTCGSRVLTKNVCQYCGCEPSKGKHYCCDCGTPTIPEAIMCVECGAGFQRRFPPALAFLIAGVLIVAFAGAGYVFFQSGKNSNEDASSAYTHNVVDTNKSRIENKAIKNELAGTIINKIPILSLPKKNTADDKLVNNVLPKTQAPKEPEKAKPEIIIKEKNNVELLVEKPLGRISTGAFSSRELRAHGASCTYFEGRNKGNVIFFTNNLSGFLKMNGKLYEMRGMEKGSDIARFTGGGYEVTIEIEGLAGSENEWLASATLRIKNNYKTVLSSHKVYSSCTEF